MVFEPTRMIFRNQRCPGSGNWNRWFLFSFTFPILPLISQNVNLSYGCIRHIPARRDLDGENAFPNHWVSGVPISFPRNKRTTMTEIYEGNRTVKSFYFSRILPTSIFFGDCYSHDPCWFFRVPHGQPAAQLETPARRFWYEKRIGAPTYRTKPMKKWEYWEYHGIEWRYWGTTWYNNQGFDGVHSATVSKIDKTIQTIHLFYHP